MDKDLLQQAREYERIQSSKIAAEDRPAFHLTPMVGWMNDPNGFSCYKGEYHLFYQYNPYNTKWGPTHWGHCKTKDFLHWEYLPAALAPDQEYDQSGCFSGSAAEMPDGSQLLMYTGGYNELSKDGTIKKLQVQCIAIGDGMNYQKISSNPILTGKELPIGGNPLDFRDPKVWLENNTWYAAIVNRTEDESGAVLLYSSSDLEHWKLEGILDRCNNEYGKMWECPDPFSLDGQGVLLVSPQENEQLSPVYRNGYETLCLLGEWKNHSFTRQAVLPIDQGLDFYAPQTLLTLDGRRVMIGWMQAWEASHYVPRNQKWFGQMSLPRELRIQNGILLQQPVKELEVYRKDRISYEAVHISGAVSLPGISGRMIDLTLKICSVEGKHCDHFIIKFANDGRHYTSLTYVPKDRTLTIDRSRSGYCYNVVHCREVPLDSSGDELDLRIILDRFSVEIFVNGGRQVLSTTLYTPQNAQDISFEANGDVSLDIEKYNICL